MNDTELYELCRKVYELTEWGKSRDLTDFYFNKRYVDEKIGFRYEIDHYSDVAREASHITLKLRNGLAVPLYTSDYLLEKLPGEFDNYYIDLSWSGKKNGWFASYFTNDYTPDRPIEKYQCSAGTPLKALLALVISLRISGVKL